MKNWKEKSNNKGFSFVLVIIAMSIVALLTAAVLLVSYQNLQMKVTGLESEDAFYSAEQAIDEIKAGLQSDMSRAVSEAYSYVLEHYTETIDQDSTRNWYFQTRYVDTLYKSLQKNSTARYDLEHLGTFIVDASPAANPAVISEEGETEEDVVLNYADTSMVKLSCESTAANPLSFSYKEGVTLKGLVVSYTNAEGYLSEVKTDLLLGIPSISFTQTESSPDLLSYCVISNGKLSVKNGLGVSTKISGNAYAGAIEVDTASLKVEVKDQLVVKDGISITAPASTGSSLKHFTFGGGALWTEGIDLDSASMSAEGSLFIRDDLTLNGNGSSASVAGNYYGYSNPNLLTDVTDEDKASSAILINGRNSVIDFSGLDNLFLAGNGYVDIAAAVFGTGDSIRMGESIAIKSNQLAYLAPADAIRVSGAEIVEGGNPILLRPTGDMSDLSIYLNTGVYLEEIGSSLSALGIKDVECKKYVAQKKNTDTSDTVYVYVYMDLDEEKAAKYAGAYFGPQMEKYAKIFLPDIAGASDFDDVFGRDTDDLNRLDINGNVANVADRNFNYDVDDEDDEVRKEVIGYRNSFEAQCKKLIHSKEELSDLELKDTSTVFTNLIDETALRNFVNGTAVFRTRVSGMDAVLVEGDYTVTSSDAKVHLIIATGNVKVEDDFSGLILCKGNLIISPGVTIKAVPEKTAAVFQCIYGTDEAVVKSGDEIISPMTFFKEGENYLLNGIASGYVAETFGEQISLSDYIYFENWKKQ